MSCSAPSDPQDPLCEVLSLLTALPVLQDVKRCLNALEELGTLQVTSQILQKNTDVVATLKKVVGAQGLKGWWQGCRTAQGAGSQPEQPSVSEGEAVLMEGPRVVVMGGSRAGA